MLSVFPSSSILMFLKLHFISPRASSKIFMLLTLVSHDYRSISISSKLSLLSKVMLRVGTPLFSFSHCLNNKRWIKLLQCLCSCRSVNEIICHGIPDARYSLYNQIYTFSRLSCLNYVIESVHVCEHASAFFLFSVFLVQLRWFGHLSVL